MPFERRGVRMRSHRQSATTLPERNLGVGLKISECGLLSTGSTPPVIRVIEGDATARKPWNRGDGRLESHFWSAK
ncbi:hypothetical protein Taro_047102 [Colocasia esculenta]|uniref:Uncharacterized protein n=1 Tax=Colocasia esculenta TaxID=4460 RepID=A0A843WUC3_COLES|nr:hypothetical protein [Colocasia esculenta]